MDAKFHSGRLPLRESGWSEVRNRLIVGNQTNLCARQTRTGKSSLTAAYRHGWLSFGCRCASAAWTIAKDSRQHLSQKGDDLPGAPSHHRAGPLAVLFRADGNQLLQLPALP